MTVKWSPSCICKLSFILFREGGAHAPSLVICNLSVHHIPKFWIRTCNLFTKTYPEWGHKKAASCVGKVNRLQWPSQPAALAKSAGCIVQVSWLTFGGISFLHHQYTELIPNWRITYAPSTNRIARRRMHVQKDGNVKGVTLPIVKLMLNTVPCYA